jgi:flagellar hook assembly protein FlgD
LSAAGSTDGNGIVAGSPPSFHPNGDGIDDTLVLTETVTRTAHIDATVANSAGAIVRRYAVVAENGTTTSDWDGKNDAGSVVPDGRYTLTYTPRDDSGATGTPVSIVALVLTAVKLGQPSAVAFFARDADDLAQKSTVAVTVSQQAKVGFQVVDSSGKVVRTVRSLVATAPGSLKFTWDGKEDNGSWAPDGWYQTAVSATTSLGSYSQTRDVYVGAFRITPSSSSPARGASLTLSIKSTEPLTGAPVVRVTQPGLAVWTASATHIQGKKYEITLQLKSGGNAGTLLLDVTGVDTNGGKQDTPLSLILR